MTPAAAKPVTPLPTMKKVDVGARAHAKTPPAKRAKVINKILFVGNKLYNFPNRN
jgi:hypothetical protein